jgi:hypothetical protein
MKLYQFTPFPPGSFPYSQVWKGVEYKFPDEGLDIQTQAARILKFRRANGLPGATFDETLDDLNVYTCQRLGNDPKWCGDGQRVAQVQKVQSRGCGGCGAVLK